MPVPKAIGNPRQQTSGDRLRRAPIHAIFRAVGPNTKPGHMKLPAWTPPCGGQVPATPCTRPGALPAQPSSHPKLHLRSMLPRAGSRQKANGCGIREKAAIVVESPLRRLFDDAKGKQRDRPGIETASSGSRRRDRPAPIGRRHGETMRAGTEGRRRYDPPVGGLRAQRACRQAVGILAMASDRHPILDNFNIFDRWDVDEKERPCPQGGVPRKECATKSASASPDPASAPPLFRWAHAVGGLYPQSNSDSLAPASRVRLRSHLTLRNILLPGGLRGRWQ